VLFLLRKKGVSNTQSATMEHKFEVSMQKYKMHVLKIQAARPKIVVIQEVPKKETPKCCASRTLEGKQCPFRALSGESFCKKHKSMV
jgi:hypothetical protein